MTFARMAMKLMAIIVASALVIVLTAGVLLPAHYIRDDETITQLLWNRHEAYVFSGIRRNGWSGNYAQAAWQLARNVLGQPPEFSTSHSWLLVVKISASGIEQKIEDNAEFFHPQPFENSIYRGLGDPVTKWSGPGFTPISEQERIRFAAREVSSEPNYANVGGWSSRMGLLNGTDRRVEVPMELDGVRAVVVADRRANYSSKITVQLEGQQPIEVLSMNEGPRFVGADEYRALMARH